MFVPTHKYIDKTEYRLTLYDAKHNIVYLDLLDGRNTLASCAGFCKDFRQIILTCPYCSSQLLQQGRVECACGCVLKAVDEEMASYLQEKAFDFTAKHPDIHLVFHHAPDIINEASTGIIRLINNIWFLEISEGKSTSKEQIE